MDISQSNWSETDGSNNAFPPDGWPSVTMLPNQVEPAARAIMGAVKRWWNRANGAYTSTGASGHYIVTPTYNGDPLSYVNGEVTNFYVHQDSVGGDDFQISNVNSLVAKPIYVTTEFGLIPVLAKNMKAGQYAEVQYQSTLNSGGGGFVLLNPVQLISAHGNTTVNSTGGTVALTSAQAFVGSLLVTGALTSNLIITVPNGTAWGWTINNETTGAFSVSLVNVTPGTAGTVPQGGISVAFTDGTNVVDGVPTAAAGNASSQIASTGWVALYYAPLASPTFTGVPLAPTAAVGTNTTQIATTAFVQAAAFLAVLPVQPGGTSTYTLQSTAGVAGWNLVKQAFGVTASGLFAQGLTYYVDTSAAVGLNFQVTATLLSKDSFYTFVDPSNSWGLNPWTLDGNGNSFYTPFTGVVAGPVTVNFPDSQFSIWWNTTLSAWEFV